MGLPLQIPDIYVPTFDMTADYSPLPPPISGQVMEISVEQHLTPPNSFRFRLSDPTLALIDPDTGIFTEGTRIEISMGFVGNTKSLIVGEITAVAANFSDSGPTTVEVEGMDLLSRLQRGTAYRRFDGPTPDSGLPDSQIVTQMAAEVGLLPDVDPTAPPSATRVQDNQSDYDFLKWLADLNGFYLWVDGETLHFKEQRPAASSLTLVWGKTLISFSARLTMAGQVNAVEARGWDPVQKQSVSGTAQRSAGSTALLSPNGQTLIARGSGGESNLLVTNAAVASAQEAQDYAQAFIDSQEQTLITGSGSSVGQPNLQVGSTLQLSGIGRFSTTYIVHQASHVLGPDGYKTSFEVRQQS
jgi:uncharacterized protein